MENLPALPMVSLVEEETAPLLEDTPRKQLPRSCADNFFLDQHTLSKPSARLSLHQQDY
jgi:hypothetical protein